MRSRTLIDAVHFQKREDRLTEILAVVLSSYQPAALAVLEQAGFHAEAAEVATQVRTPRGKRIDMQIVALDGRGSVVGRVWSEHKTGAPYMDGQLEGYADELSGFSTQTKLITIADRGAERRDGSSWKWFTWDEVAHWLDAVGRRETGEQRWRRVARSGQAEAAIWMLDELLLYLEEEHEVMLEPLTPLDVVAFGSAQSASEILTELLERAAEESDPYTADGAAAWAKDDWGTIWQTFEPVGWSVGLDAYPELIVAKSDFWLDDLIGAPAFGAGITIPSRVRDSLLEAKGGAWLGEAADRGFCLYEDHATRIYRTLYATDLVGKGTSIDEQAKALSVWFSEAMDVIDDLDPELARS